MVVDDSALIHGGVYDPVKARAYYLRTRQLKGRSRAVAPASGGRAGPRTQNDGSSPIRNKDNARQNARERLNQLEGRLKRLRLLLAKRVEAAQSRSGVQKNSQEKQETKSKASSSTDDKKSSSKGGSSKSTAAERREDAKRARENYEKKGPRPQDSDPSIQQEIAQVRKQIAETEAALRKIAQRARENHTGKSKSQTARNGR